MDAPSGDNIPFELQVAIVSDCVVIRLLGEASHKHSTEMQNALLAELERPVRGYIVDMSGLTGITSVGLGAIVSTYVSCLRRKKPFCIAGATGKVLAMFQVAKLSRLFQIAPTVDEAIKTINAA